MIDIKKEIEKIINNKHLSYWDIERIISFSLLPNFFDYLNILPKTIIENLKKRALSPIGHPEDIYFVSSYCGPSRSEDEWYRDDLIKSNIYYWTAKKLSEYFYPENKLPDFQVMKKLGCIEKKLVYDDLIFIGKGLFYRFNRNKQIHCIKPDKSEIITSAQFFNIITDAV